MSVVEFIQVFLMVLKGVIEGLLSVAPYILSMHLVILPATTGKYDQTTKRDIQYARCTSAGELELIDQNDRPEHGFASWFPSAYCIDHLRAAIKTEAHKRRQFGIHLAIFLALLCVDGYAIYCIYNLDDQPRDVWEYIWNALGFEAGSGSILWLVGWIGHMFCLLSFFFIVGYAFWSTALQALWVHQLWTYEPGTVIIVPRPAKAEEKAGVTRMEKNVPMNE